MTHDWYRTDNFATGAISFREWKCIDECGWIRGSAQGRGRDARECWWILNVA